MTKKQRIEQLEKEIVGLKARLEVLEAGSRGWWSIELYPKPPYIPTWATPDTIWPYEITSHMVNLNDNPDAAKALYQNRWELYDDPKRTD